jgi:hypothetical protein
LIFGLGFNDTAFAAVQQNVRRGGDHHFVQVAVGSYVFVYAGLIYRPELVVMVNKRGEDLIDLGDLGRFALNFYFIAPGGDLAAWESSRQLLYILVFNA